MTISEYKTLLQSFLDQQISIAAFETAYLATVKTEPADISAELYPILQELFWAVDSYSPECQVGEETAFTISEQKLRQVANDTLLNLNLQWPNLQIITTKQGQRFVVLSITTWENLLTSLSKIEDKQIILNTLHHLRLESNMVKPMPAEKLLY